MLKETKVYAQKHMLLLRMCTGSLAKDFHRTQCTKPTPLALDNFRHFSMSSMTFSVVIENAVGFNVLCESLTRRSRGCPFCLRTFSKKHPKINYISP